MLLLMTVEQETGAEIFERILLGYHVSEADQLKQLKSALDELYYYSEPRQAVQLRLFELPDPVAPAPRRQLQLVPA